MQKTINDLGIIYNNLADGIENVDDKLRWQAQDILSDAIAKLLEIQNQITKQFCEKYIDNILE